MPRRTMLLADGLTVRAEAAAYAIQLARRTSTDLVLLVLLPADEGAGGVESGGNPDPLAGLEERLIGHMRQARAAGVRVEAIVRTGDPASELMKYLAAAGTFQAIIWGGAEDVLRGGGRDRGDHWLAGTGELAGCPVVVPTKKS